MYIMYSYDDDKCHVQYSYDDMFGDESAKRLCQVSDFFPIFSNP